MEVMLGIMPALLVLSQIFIFFVSSPKRGYFAYLQIVLNSILSSYIAVWVLLGNQADFTLSGSYITGPIGIQIDALSAWFILVFNFTFLTGGFYGIFYMESYSDRVNNLLLHWLVFPVLHFFLLTIIILQNTLAFLVAWEVMAISAFVLVIFEGNKPVNLKAGLNYLIQSHVSVIFITIAVLWIYFRTSSFDFSAISTFTKNTNEAQTLLLFLMFFLGFALKAGFVPFHTWLPYAHPSAPSHVSGIMSGVLIKIGIYGILRMILLIHTNYLVLGYFILAISIITGVYGVMLAIIQHNLKRLLAYHSIENIGIIGIGIGVGCIGLGLNNNILITLGFAGALLHTLNHSLFKSLLFFTSGNVYSATHTLNIESLGGLVKKMPHTSLLFLVAALAITGLPPFNGFVSEFLIYIGLFEWLSYAKLSTLIFGIIVVLALVLIGGFALICFTKAFSVVFLGEERNSHSNVHINEAPKASLVPLYLIASLIVAIGVFPKIFINVLLKPTSLFANPNFISSLSGTESIPVNLMSAISLSALMFIGFVVLIWGIRWLITREVKKTMHVTWGCGYVAPNERMQYTASSFVKSYAKLFKMVLLIFKHEKPVEKVFPVTAQYESHPYDRIEHGLIDKPIRGFKSILGKLTFLQNGRLQLYILYGIVFIGLLLVVPVITEWIIRFFEVLKQI